MTYENCKLVAVQGQDGGARGEVCCCTPQPDKPRLLHSQRRTDCLYQRYVSPCRPELGLDPTVVSPAANWFCADFWVESGGERARLLTKHPFCQK